MLSIKKGLIFIIKLCVAGLCFWFLLTSAQIKLGLCQYLFSQPVYLTIILVYFIGLIFLGAWRWYVLNQSQTIGMNYRATLMAAYFAGAFNNVLPGSIGGDAIRFYYVFKHEPQKKARALISLFSDRLLGFLAIFLIIFVMSLVRLSQLYTDPKIAYIMGSCSLFCVSLLGAFAVGLWVVKRTTLVDWIEARYTKRWMIPLLSFLKTLRLFQMRKVDFIKCLLLSGAMQVVIASIVVLIAKLLHFPSLSFMDYLLVMAVTQIINLIPLTPGGLGIGEVGFAHTLALLNPGLIMPYATVFFIYRMLSVVIFLPVLVWYGVASPSLRWV